MKAGCCSIYYLSCSLNTGRTNNSQQSDSSSGKATPEPATNDDDDAQPNSRSAIFRHRGITQAKKSKYWNDKVEQVSF